MKFLSLLALPLLLSPMAHASLDLTFSTACSKQNEQITISFVGDILIHKPLYLSVLNGNQHFYQIWEKTVPLFLRADFSVGNVEGPSALGIDRKGHDHGDIGFKYDDEVYSGTNLVFNYHPRLLSDLQDSGFDLITTANNHALDRTSIGIDKTILSARALSLSTVGTIKANDSKGEFFKIVRIKNMKVAFIACTEVLNDPDNFGQVLNCEEQKIFALIKSVSNRSDVDALIVLPHWGVEYSNDPKDFQIDFARRYLEAGAVAVIGSHPHVLERWEKYTTKNGRETLIIYSLGNFVAFQNGLEKQTGAVAYLGLSKSTGQKAKVYGAAYTPTIRIDHKILPIGNGNYPDARKHVASKYGTESRVEPGVNLSNVMCR